MYTRLNFRGAENPRLTGWAEPGFYPPEARAKKFAFGALGIEPRLRTPEARVLPLYYAPLLAIPYALSAHFT